MTPPSASTLTTVALVPLLAWRIHARFRRSYGRQRLSRFRAPISLAIYALLISVVALANAQRLPFLAGFALALLAGGALAAHALRKTRFEPTPQGLYYTPHGPIGVSLAVLFLARIVWRLAQVVVLGAAVQPGLAGFAQSPLTLATFGLVAGYQAWYTVGLARWRFRVLRAKKAREAAARES